MPDGRTHHNFWLTFLFTPFLAGVLLAVYFLVRQSFIGVYVGAGLVIGYLLGNFIDPDLDQVSITGAEGRLLHIPVIGVILVAWFLPYGYFFKHRSFLSHFPFVSTAIRLLYMAFLPCLAVVFFIGIPTLFQEIRALEFSTVLPAVEHWLFVTVPAAPAAYVVLGAYLGLSFSDSIHWALDSLGVGKHRKKDRIKQMHYEDNQD